MYSTRSGLILGFHGCDQAVADKVIGTGESLYASENRYDWLGEGIYFWDQSPERARHYAQELKDHPRHSKNPIQNPAVVGAVLDLGFCLDLVNMDNLSLLEQSYQSLKATRALAGLPALENQAGRDSLTSDLVRRELDCQIINGIHQSRQRNGERPFDSVRGVFWEGEELYPTAGFRRKNHIQVAVRNPNCVKGYFRPRFLDLAHNLV